jgi:hypothetical protein
MAKEGARADSGTGSEDAENKQSAISRLENHTEDIRLSTLEQCTEAVRRKIELNII